MRGTNYKLIIIISLIVITSLSTTYAYLQLSDNSTAATGEAGCFAVNYTGQVIDGATMQSTIDYNEDIYSTVTLSKNENCEIYSEAEIRIHTNDTTTAPIAGENQAIKYKVKKISGDGTILSGGEGFVNQIGDITLATVSLTETDTVYKVYIWIDNNLSQGQYDEKIYSGYIYATSIQTSTIPQTENKPNLDNGNLIPVYFDETAGTYGSWKKADSNNTNKSWYNYTDKRWANAVVIADSAKKATYRNAAVGTTINDADITAFYVWIPRFKYRVWNINRQGTTEDKYAYSAYTSGIQIEFEKGTASTGNVVCNYNDQTTGSATSLNDSCTVNGTAVAYNTSNLTYGESNQAWYTHPAFTFGDDSNKNKTGFWIGKFETSGTVNANNIADNPTILPDVSALRSQAVSEQFMSAKNFQNYLPNSTLDAHMLTNLEWGAVAYLTHSTYGLCNGTSCQGVYINNSYGTSCYFTGRSGGAIAGNSALNLVNVYGSSVTTSTTKYNCNGYYDYKGYKLDYSTGAPTTKENNKLASTTQNITGVYDMSGGSQEYVMGNMVSESKVFYPSSAGNKWNNTDWYDTANSRLYNKYYNSYAYGTNNSTAIAFNRARLGDATAEVLGGTATTSSWKPGNGGRITGSYSSFVSSSSSWFLRGSYSGSAYSGAFSFSSNDGGGSGSNSFRSSLS